VGEDNLVRRRSQPRESKARHAWRAFRFELIWLVVVAIGAFLLLERLSLRQTLTAWARTTFHRILSRAQQLDEQVGALLTQVSLSDVIGSLLVAAAVVALLLRIRWRLLHDARLTKVACPRCGGAIHRTHRKRLDRLVCLYVPVRRYCCSNRECRWKGLRVGRGHGGVPESSRVSPELGHRYSP
jgi:hypothetical protein